jgi:predicted molibdopterin-dependent oxidoreductase YjgC
MFRRLPDAKRATVRFTVDGRSVEARAGDSVAAAMLAAGIASNRRSLSGAARAPYCMMGACFDCLVVIDGVGNRQGCQVRVRDGMVVATQPAKRDAGR